MTALTKPPNGVESMEFGMGAESRVVHWRLKIIVEIIVLRKFTATRCNTSLL